MVVKGLGCREVVVKSLWERLIESAGESAKALEGVESLYDEPIKRKKGEDSDPFLRFSAS